MREDPLRDGSVALYADHDDNDSVTVEPIITAFTAMRGALFCVCGAPLRSWSWRCTPDSVEIGCDRCHRVHGHIQLATKVYHR
jgi:hypothetical protein